MKPEDQARLRNQDTAVVDDDELLVDVPGGCEPDEDAFEEFKED